MSLLRPLQALLGVAVVGYAIQGAVNEGASAFWENWAYPGLILAAGLLCAARAVAVRANRLAWSLLAAGMLLWVAGEASYALFLADLEAPPVPSVSDVLWLAFYPACLAGIVLLVVTIIRRRRARTAAAAATAAPAAPTWPP